MTGGTLLVLGAVGANFGAGMTGGRAYVLDPTGAVRGRLDATSVTARSLRDHLRADDAVEIGRLLRLHRDAGSRLAAELLDDEPAALRSFWAVDPREVPVERPAVAAPVLDAGPAPASAVATGTQPNRSRSAIAAGA